LGAIAVALELRIGEIDAVEKPSCEGARWARDDELEIGPASLARALDEAGFRQQLEMAADARLALAEDTRHVLDVELACREQQQDAQPRRLGGSFQDGDDALRRQWHSGPPPASAPRVPKSYKDIFMCQELFPIR